jgi:hypothetical protein
MPPPTLDDFRSAVHRHFAFVSEEFGFVVAETPADGNPFAVHYVSDLVRVVVEGLSYGLDARVAVGTTDWPHFQNFDLLDVLQLDQPPAINPLGKFRIGQIDQVVAYAKAMRDSQSARAILSGDVTAFPRFQAMVQKRAAQFRNAPA